MSKPLITLQQLSLLPAEEKPATRAKVVRRVEDNRFQRLKLGAEQEIEAVFPAKLEKNMAYHFVSRGAFSMHHLIRHILRTTGPCSLYFSTWAISEGSARTLVELRQSGQLVSIACLLDVRAKTRHESATHMLSQHCDKLRQAHCHAKVSVLLSPEWHIVILGSANYTENPRIEVGSIHTHPALAEFHTNWLYKEIYESNN